MRAGTILMVVALIHAITTSAVFAQNDAPIGRWKTIDDETGQARSVVKIWLDNGVLLGRIESVLLKPGDDPNPKCEKCSGDKKNHPLVGMTILWGLTPQGEAWTGGYVLDPDDGNIYKCTVKLGESGTTLAVHGYVGFAFLGRTQTWTRVD